MVAHNLSGIAHSVKIFSELPFGRARMRRASTVPSFRFPIAKSVFQRFASFFSPLAPLQAIIKNADMSEDMQQDCVDCASQAMEKFTVEKDIAACAFFISLWWLDLADELLCWKPLNPGAGVPGSSALLDRFC